MNPYISLGKVDNIGPRWLAEGVHREIAGWTSMEELMVDEVVDKDMGTQHGKWTDFSFEAFEEGVDIENGILSTLMDKLIHDLMRNLNLSKISVAQEGALSFERECAMRNLSANVFTDFECDIDSAREKRKMYTVFVVVVKRIGRLFDCEVEWIVDFGASLGNEDDASLGGDNDDDFLVLNEDKASLDNDNDTSLGNELKMTFRRWIKIRPLENDDDDDFLMLNEDKTSLGNDDNNEFRCNDNDDDFSMLNEDKASLGNEDKASLGNNDDNDFPVLNKDKASLRNDDDDDFSCNDGDDDFSMLNEDKASLGNDDDD
ncbi:hypothetical protein H5410_014391 [Solanum commersonii]|uniref:DUF4378 domain-containing protein n=1 Tax=Solanum commersonii TaxID=4109 RepID=A0A9J5ZRB5_SOLCO|nr:hypothetical protein H5410_014391 [Solanum commersonii]